MAAPCEQSMTSDHRAFSRTAERTGSKRSYSSCIGPPSHTSHSSVGRANLMPRFCARFTHSRFSSSKLAASASRQPGIRLVPTPRRPAPTQTPQTSGGNRTHVDRRVVLHDKNLVGFAHEHARLSSERSKDAGCVRSDGTLSRSSYKARRAVSASVSPPLRQVYMRRRLARAPLRRVWRKAARLIAPSPPLVFQPSPRKRRTAAEAPDRCSSSNSDAARPSLGRPRLELNRCASARLSPARSNQVRAPVRSHGYRQVRWCGTAKSAT